MISSSAESGPLLDRLQELQDLGLDRDVERGRRLVGDQQLRLAGEGHRDHHALAHAARHLVRVLLDPALRARDADQLERLDRPVPGLLALDLLVELDLLGDLVADA